MIKTNIFCLVIFLCFTNGVVGQPRPDTIEVEPEVSTSQVVFDADDPAVWVHPTDPSESLILGTDKGTYPNGGLFVWNMDGSQQQRMNISHPNNVDVRYGMQLAGKQIDIAAVTMRDHWQIRIFKVDPDSRTLSDISSQGGIDVFAGPYGLALYKRPEDGAMFAIISSKIADPDEDELIDELWQVRLHDDGTGKVTGTRVRVFGDITGVVEGMVVDDELGYLYIAEESVGIHKYYADPENGDERLALFATADGITGHRKGLALYGCSDGTGYIMLSNPDTRSIKVYPRQGTPADPHKHHLIATILNARGQFGEGIDITNQIISDEFPHGFLIWHNEAEKQFSLYGWDNIAQNPLTTCIKNTPGFSADFFSFEGQVNGASVTLSWTITSPPDLIGFEVQHRTPQSAFEKLAFVPAIANSDEPLQTYFYVDEELNSGVYYYRLNVIKARDGFSFSQELQANITKPEKLELKQNYPNPFNPETVISFQLPRTTLTRLVIYNLIGQEIKTLVDAQLPAGEHAVRWDGTDRSSNPVVNGVYLYKLKTGQNSEIRRMVLLR